MSRKVGSAAQQSGAERFERRQLRGARFAALAVLTGSLAWGLGSMQTASAFNCGYTPCNGTGGSAAGFTNTVAAKNVSAAGGTVSGKAYGATITVTVPAGTLPAGGEVVIGSGVPPSIAIDQGKVVVDFSVFLIDPATGENLGPFSPGVTVTISKQSMKTTDVVTLISEPGQVTVLHEGPTSRGEVDLTLTTNENIAVVRSVPLT